MGNYEYSDGPHKTPNDDHPPTGIKSGQTLLADLHSILTSNPARWAKTLLIVTYDEHGGFFDHVPPLPISSTIAGQHIATTGVRVPAFLISPQVIPGSVFPGPLDHTSILQVIAERFGNGSTYSPLVERRQNSLDRISHALTPKFSGVKQVVKIARPPATKVVPTMPLKAAAPLPNFATPNALALDAAARKFILDHPDLAQDSSWKDLRTYVKTVDPSQIVAPVAKAP